MPADAAFPVGKMLDVNQPFRRYDFTVDKFAPHFAAIRRAQTGMTGPARPEIHFGLRHCGTFWPEPLLQALTLRPRLPHCLTRRVKYACDNEGPFSRLIGCCCHVR